MGSGQVILAGVGIVVALMFGAISVLNIGLYAAAGDQDNDVSDSSDCRWPCRGETQALGIVAGSLGVALAVGFCIIILLPAVVASLGERAPNVFSKSILLMLVFVVWVFYITAWSLMSKDIHDFNDNDLASEYCDNPPHVWNAALAFGLFGWFGASLLLLVAFIGLISAFMSSGNSQQ